MSNWKRVRIVADEIMISMHMEDTPAGLGHTVLTAASQHEAEAILDADVIDLAVVDCHLPDGTSARRALELQERGVPSVVCSGTMDKAAPDA